MSGYPNQQDIAELRVQLRAIQDADAGIAQAQGDKQRAETALQDAKEQLGTAKRRVAELLGSMDCGSPGNTGYQNRLLVLLTELNKPSQ